MDSQESGPAARRRIGWRAVAAIVVAAAAFTAVVVAVAAHLPETMPTPGSSCACASASPTPPPGAISRDAAIQAAVRAVPSAAEDPVVVWAALEPYPFADATGADRPLVWEVRLEGSIQGPSCAPGYFERWPTRADAMCLDNESGVVIVLDAFTGQLLGWNH
jgi:hypothetical protein